MLLAARKRGQLSSVQVSVFAASVLGALVLDAAVLAASVLGARARSSQLGLAFSALEHSAAAANANALLLAAMEHSGQHSVQRLKWW